MENPYVTNPSFSYLGIGLYKHSMNYVKVKPCNKKKKLSTKLVNKYITCGSLAKGSEGSSIVKHQRILL